MTISFQHSATEAKIDKAIKKLPYQQTIDQFVNTSIQHYVKLLVKDKVIKK